MFFLVFCGSKTLHRCDTYKDIKFKRHQGKFYYLKNCLRKDIICRHGTVNMGENLTYSEIV